MPRKGMRSLRFVPETPSSSIHKPSQPSASKTPAAPFSFFDSMMAIDLLLERADAIITKWNPDSTTFGKVTSLFYESKEEAENFFKCVYGLQKSMQLIIIEDPASQKLILAHNLMQIAMKRLEKEFYQILSMNRALLDPESVSARSSRTSARSSTSDFDEIASTDTDDEIRVASDSISEVEEASRIVMSDLRSIAECMIACGYTKECVSLYKTMRKSIIDEGIYRLGVEKLTVAQANKMEWEVLDIKIKNWLEAVKISTTTLFMGERIISDHIFASSDSIRESCFTDISKGGAMLMFGFPEIVITSGRKSKKPSPAEKIFRVLDMYKVVSNSWKEIELIFNFQSATTIRSQALTSLILLGESSRTMLADFESKIENDSSKALITGGGVHNFTITSMNYVSLLSDYSTILNDIFLDWSPPEKSPLSKSYFDNSFSKESLIPSISLRISWIVLVILSKLDEKANQYKDVSLSYLFLANNLKHVISVVTSTPNLQYLLGTEWIEKHELKMRRFASRYERLVWGPVYSSLPDDPTAKISTEETKDRFTKFSDTFDDACRKQRSNTVPDQKLRDEIKVTIARKLVPVYRKFYDTHRGAAVGGTDVSSVKFTPGDVENLLGGSFLRTDESKTSSAPSSASSAAPSLESTASLVRKPNSRFSLRRYIRF